MKSLYCSRNKENDSCIKNLNYYKKDEWLKHSDCSVLVMLVFFPLRSKCQKSNPESLGPLGSGFLLNGSNLALCKSENCCGV